MRGKSAAPEPENENHYMSDSEETDDNGFISWICHVILREKTPASVCTFESNQTEKGGRTQ